MFGDHYKYNYLIKKKVSRPFRGVIIILGSYPFGLVIIGIGIMIIEVEVKVLPY